jgi:hypothetical protein
MAEQYSGLMNDFMAALTLYTSTNMSKSFDMPSHAVSVVEDAGCVPSTSEIGSMCHAELITEHGGASSSQLTDLHASLYNKGIHGCAARSHDGLMESINNATCKRTVVSMQGNSTQSVTAEQNRLFVAGEKPYSLSSCHDFALPHGL